MFEIFFSGGTDLESSYCAGPNDLKDFRHWPLSHLSFILNRKTVGPSHDSNIYNNNNNININK